MLPILRWRVGLTLKEDGALLCPSTLVVIKLLPGKSAGRWRWRWGCPPGGTPQSARPCWGRRGRQWRRCIRRAAWVTGRAGRVSQRAAAAAVPGWACWCTWRTECTVWLEASRKELEVGCGLDGSASTSCLYIHKLASLITSENRSLNPMLRNWSFFRRILPSACTVLIRYFFRQFPTNLN